MASAADLYRLCAFLKLAEILSAPVSAVLMTVSSWEPYLLGIVLIALGIPIAYLFP